MSDVDCRFLPWFRCGVATFIDTPDDAAAAVRFSAPARVLGVGDAVEAPVTLFGPGDVVGLGDGQVLAREPEAGTVGFEPNYFPHVDLAAADLPWRYTPARAAADGKLRPWLVLVALEKTETLAVHKAGRAPAPVVKASVAELPDLSESALWAHVQVAGPFDATPLAEVVRDQPDRARARLICPRRLAPQTEYLICVVPAFEVGRLAGMAEPADEAALGLQPAWVFDPASTAYVSLPVYDHWSFATGVAGDFESLARALAPHQVEAAGARRPFELDPILAGQTGEELPLAGALQPIVEPPPPVEAPAAAVTSALAGWLNRSADVEDGGGDPRVTPPIYGRWHAGVRRVAQPATPQWLNELNLDPRHRIAAAAGGDVVQRHQDEFVDSAWEQAGEVSRANALLRRAQLARSAGECLKQRHFERLPDDLMLQIAGPGQARTKHGSESMKTAVQASAVPELGFSGAFRRLSRVRGPHMSRHRGAHPVHAEEVLFEQRFVETPLAGWQVVDSLYAVSGPSSWSWSADQTSLYQTSNIYVPETAPNETAVSYRGTMFVGGSGTWRDLSFSFTVTPQDNDAVGFVFRYQNDRYYYRFSMDAQRSYRRLVKVYAGGVATLWEDTYAYQPGLSYTFHLTLEDDRIVIRQTFLYSTLTLVDLHDPSLAYGRVGFYSWGSDNTRFFNIRCSPQAGLSGSLLGPHVSDQGNVAAPSQWRTEGGALVQSANIYSLPQDRDALPMLGTYLRVGEGDGWEDVVLEATLKSEDDDALGLMFRYRDASNYYRFSMDQQRSYMRLVRCQAGQFTLLWQIDEGYASSTSGHPIRIVADGSRLRGYLQDRRLFDLRDQAHQGGGVGFYCWGNADSWFKNVSVRQIRPRGLMERLNAGELGISIPAGGALDLPSLAQTFLSEADAGRTVPGRVLERVVAPEEAASPRDDLEPMVLGPQIPLPLSTRLIDMAPHLILPGLEQIPDNAVAALERNPSFIAAFMAGANHEMARELLWRGLATDLRATVFRQFWDVRGGQLGAGTEAEREAHKDIGPISGWDPAGGLASQVGGDGSMRSIFLVRSELIRRFPDAGVFLVRAEPDGFGGRRPGLDTVPHLFRGRLAADMAFFGFDLPPSEVRGSGAAGDLGCYFTIEQAPTGARFGLDAGGQPGETLGTWADLGWNHVAGGAHLDADTLDAIPPAGAGQPVWGENGAHMAAITQQKPVRIFIHAQRLIPEPVAATPPVVPPPPES